MLLALRCNSYIIMKIFSCCLVLFCLLPGRIDAACEVSNGGCSPGKYCSSSKNDNGDQLCLSCDPGLYQNAKSTVLNQCKMCPKGKYNTNHNSKASSACLQCQRGQYVAQDGSSSCKNCPSGTYGDRKGLNSESSCRPCALGRYNDSPVGGFTWRLQELFVRPILRFNHREHGLYNLPWEESLASGDNQEQQMHSGLPCRFLQGVRKLRGVPYWPVQQRTGQVL